MIPQFSISREIKNKLNDCRLGIIKTDVAVGRSSHTLLKAVENQISQIRKNHTIDEVSSLLLIEETKNAYRLLGKDPTRYRPSAEALIRRILQGKGLYQVNNIVDLLNLVSIRTGYSIGGYDASRIKGMVTLTTGGENEPYEAIGRGDLNIYQLPVLADETGAFGSPTSDSARTMVRDSTSGFIMVLFDFYANSYLDKAILLSSEYLQTFGSSERIYTEIVE